MVVVQILMGIVLGPGVLGAHFPEYYNFVFSPTIIQSLNGIAWWAVMLFVFIAGLELDLTKAWRYHKESGITAGFALGTPLIFGCGAGLLLLQYSGWIGSAAEDWQFVLGIGMSCAVTALPILILLLEKLELLRQPIGQRILRYASLDDIMIWAVLAIVLLDWERIGRQAIFLSTFAVASWGFRKFLASMKEADRWYFSLMWLVAVAFAADWSGLHYMVGAFMAGAVIDSHMFDQKRMDFLRHNVLLIIMPVFFLSTGLRTNWGVGGSTVFLAATVLLFASITGKLLGLRIAGKILKWGEGEASIIGWLLQTKALIMIIFSNVLLDKNVITADTFTALLIMAIVSTMLTVPMVAPKIARNETLVAKIG
jgi:Kef-type K+ transport system membrane component KefB